MEIELRVFSDSVLDVSEWWDPRLGRFISGVRAAVSHEVGGRMAPASDWTLRKRE